MSEANNKTIHTYDGGVKAYIDGTPQVVSGNQKRWIDAAFSDVAKDARILEIGSAFGRDARYLMELGYSPTLSDATPSFVEYLRSQGLTAEVLDIVTDRPSGEYDVIFASAVFLHFTDEDFDTAAQHVKDALRDGESKFIFSLKQGEGEEWTSKKMGNERYFKYWNRPLVEQRLGALGFSIVNSQTFEDDGWICLTTNLVEM